MTDRGHMGHAYGALSDREKRYAGVVTLTTADGLVTPLEILWDDGRRFKVDRVTVNGLACQTLQVTNRQDVSAYLASIGVSSGGFGYIEVSFDQTAARNAAKEFFTANGSRQPWLVFHFNCTGVRQDGVRVSDEFDLYQAPV